MERALEECVSYFRKYPVFERILRGFQEKYSSLGHMGGNVRLQNLSPEDVQVLEGFFGKNFKGKSGILVSSERMRAALESSRFGTVSLEQLVEACFCQPLVSRKEEQSRLAARKEEFFGKLLEDFSGTYSGDWLRQVLHDKEGIYKTLIKQYNAGEKQCYSLLDTVMGAANQLPVFAGKQEQLAVFAARTTRDPHYFDQGREGGRLLDAIIAWRLGQTEADTEQLQSHAERHSARLFAAGLIKDNVSSFTLAYGIRCVQRGGGLHHGIEGYRREGEPVHISLWTLGQIEKIYAAGNRVYAVENPAVFSALVEGDFREHSVICTNGQPRLSTLIILDKLCAGGAKIYYAGDFDPEGLQMAWRLKRRYRDQLEYWHYDEEDYRMAMSDVRLTEGRLKKLYAVNDPGLEEIKSLLLREKRAGYQERLIEVYRPGR